MGTVCVMCITDMSIVMSRTQMRSMRMARPYPGPSTDIGFVYRDFHNSNLRLLLLWRPPKRLATQILVPLLFLLCKILSFRTTAESRVHRIPAFCIVVSFSLPSQVSPRAGIVKAAHCIKLLA